MIKYLKGDATKPVGFGSKAIVHICNDVGKWGKGFVLSVSRRWKQPETQYLDWYRQGFYRLGDAKISFKLGNIQAVNVGEDITVINMIGQRNVYPHERVPIRYQSVRQALTSVSELLADTKTTIHMPRIGTALAKGRWEEIEPIILDTLNQFDVFVYDWVR